MKKTILAIIATAMAMIPASAGKHLSFKGVEITGTKDEMVAALSKKGFRYEEENDGVPLVIGTFAGFRDVEVNVIPAVTGDEVVAIRAEFPVKMNWVKLENDYSTLKSLLIKKYGEPAEVVEEFRDGPHDESGKKLLSLIRNNCTWKSVFDMKEGRITLFMKHQGPICCVCMLYEDNAGTKAVEKAVLKEI
ncbi:MAG: hypothetical protein J5771_02340 [Bacteroidales bacterium]|nr:hypothetical protein [Bacteroidales bacterium]